MFSSLLLEAIFFKTLFPPLFTEVPTFQGKTKALFGNLMDEGEYLYFCFPNFIVRLPVHLQFSTAFVAVLRFGPLQFGQHVVLFILCPTRGELCKMPVCHHLFNSTLYEDMRRRLNLV